MKTVRIFLLVLIVIGIVLLFTQNIWVPKLVDKILLYESTPVVLQTAPINIKNITPETTISKDVTCNDNINYFVVSRDMKDSVGTDILVKYKTDKDQHFNCNYVVEKNDFEIKNNFLITDNGTGPDPRVLVIYNLNSRKEVFTDEYFSQDLIIQDNAITYWSPTSQKATSNNCPKLDEYLSDGLGTEIDSYIALDLATLLKKELGEYRCYPIQ